MLAFRFQFVVVKNLYESHLLRILLYLKPPVASKINLAFEKLMKTFAKGAAIFKAGYRGERIFFKGYHSHGSGSGI